MVLIVTLQEQIIKGLSGQLEGKARVHPLSPHAFESEYVALFEKGADSRSAYLVLDGKPSDKNGGLAQLVDQLLEINKSSKLSGLLIYIHKPVDFILFYSQLPELAKKLRSDIPNAYIIETSSLFNTYPATDLDTTLTGMLVQYGKFLASVVEELIDRRPGLSTKAAYKYLHRNNLRLNRYLTLMNHSYFRDFQLSTVSFIADKIKDYLIDVPFKHYYTSQNRYIKDENLDNVYYKDDDKSKGSVEYKAGFNFTYMRYFLNPEKPKEVQPDLILCGNSMNDQEIQRIFDREAQNPKPDHQMMKWVTIMHTATFYVDEVLKNNEHWENLQSFLHYSPDVPATDVIELFWYYHAMDLEDKDLHGLLSYSFYSKNAPHARLTDAAVWKMAKELYTIRKPLIQAQAKETLIPYYSNEVKRQAIKSAVSAVMSRNMSHNIGSHVLARFIQKLGNGKSSKGISNDEPFFKTNLTSLLTYLQVRMEFLADISTSVQSLSFSRKAKEEILDHFLDIDPKYDLVNKEHLHHWPFYILQNISGTEEVEVSLSKESNLSIKFFNEASKEAIIDMPNDLYGCHAFYVILENLIRNAVKHDKIPTVLSNRKGQEQIKKLRLTIRIKQSETHPNDLFTVSITDNLGEANPGRNNWHNAKGNEVSFDDYLNDKIQRSILNENGALRQGDWGLLEMKICACYLRNIDIERIDENTIDGIPLLSVELDDKGNLTYHFCLLKPKLAIVLVNPGNTDNVESYKGVDFRTFSDAELDHFKKYASHHKYIITSNKDIDGQLLNRKVVSPEGLDYKSTSLELDLSKKWTHSHNWQAEIKVCDKKEEQVSPIGHSLVFHDHGEDSPLPHQKNVIYYESFNSRSMTSKIIEKYRSLHEETAEKKLLRLELIETAMTGVIVVDERLQDALKNKIPELRKMCVYIPNPENLYLYKQQFEAGIDKKFEGWLKEVISEADTGIEYLIIHMGIVEKLIGSTHVDKIKEFIEKIEGLFEQEKKWVKIVFTSGRGLPSNLPGYVFYLPFTLLNHYLISYQSKYGIVKILQSLQRTIM